MADVDPRDEYQARLRQDIPRELFLDVQDKFPIASAGAKTAVFGSELAKPAMALDDRRGNRAAGLVRFQFWDQAFEDIVARHGGELIASIPLDDLKGEPKSQPLYLTTARFGGTLLGFCSHRDVDDLPVSNQTRRALCAFNQGLDLDLFSKESFGERRRFASILVRRDRFDIGKIASISIGLIDAKVSSYIVKSEINEFVAGYGAVQSVDRVIPLKRRARRFGQRGPDSDAAGKET